MKCRETKKQLKMMQDGGQMTAGALAHIRDCKTCSCEQDIIMKLKQAFARQENVKVPGDFNKKVWYKINAPAPAREPFFRPVFVFGGAAAAAAALLIVFAVRNGAVSKAAAVIANAPAAVKTQLAVKKEYLKKIMTAKKAGPAEGKGHAVIAAGTGQGRTPAAVSPQETGAGSSGGMPVALNPAGQAQKYYHINEPSAGNGAAGGVAAASINKHPVENTAQLVIKNNVIRPLSGGRMTMDYRIDSACDVSIIVYNRKGEPVKTVFKGSRQAGSYEDYWAGDDDRDIAVTDGIYVVCIKTGQTEQRIKAMVVK
jgi:hypothetical protein